MYEIVIFHELAPRNAIKVGRMIVEVDVDEKNGEYLYARTRRIGQQTGLRVRDDLNE